MGRIKYFDFLQGIAIIMLVAIHCYSHSSGSSFGILIRQITNVAVPMFFAISGFFLAKKNLANKDGYISFLKKQVPKVYIPTLIWSIPIFVQLVIDGYSFPKNVIYFFFADTRYIILSS